MFEGKEIRWIGFVEDDAPTSTGANIVRASCMLEFILSINLSLTTSDEDLALTTS